MARPLEQVCLPQPKSWCGSGMAEARELQFVWMTELCPRVQAYAAKLLANYQLGSLKLHVRSVVDVVPQYGDDESYELSGDPSGFTLRAKTTWGGLRGIATLYQMAALGALGDDLIIEDAPRFGWRGVLIDVARHFMPVELLIRVLDGMALLKMNVMHLHLSDDQGFRFPSTLFPKLASDQHYARAELQALVAYASDLGIRVVPELDMPGHTTSWLTAYPEWGYRPVSSTQRFGVHKACLDVSSPVVMQVLNDLIAEFVEVFPDAHFHLGGDEVHADWWQTDPNMASHVTSLGLEHTSQVQNAFNQEVVEILSRHNRLAIGWDEVLGESMPTIMVQNWRGTTTRDQALKQGMQCIVSAPYYLDLHYPAEMHYTFDPQGDQESQLQLEDQYQNDLKLAHVAEGLRWTHQWRDDALHEPQPTDQVVGGEACLWSELVDAQVLEVRLWSRLPAVAERLWSPATVTDVENFYQRLEPLLTLPAFALVAKQESQLRSLGLSAVQVGIVRLFEPTKWYARLLGQPALEARIQGQEMPQARPYKVDTPLNRLVDFLSPESLSARHLGYLEWSDWLVLAQVWCGLDAKQFPQDIHIGIQALRTVGELIIQHGSACPQDQLLACYGPHDGEFMLAVVPVLLAWAEQHAYAEQDA